MARDLGRFLQPASARERAALAEPRSGDTTEPRTSLPALPGRIGPVEFGNLGAMVSVRCPRDLDPLMRAAGGLWEPGSPQWLIERWRMGPLMRELRRSTDPLFRRAGMDLDGEDNR